MYSQQSCNIQTGNKSNTTDDKQGSIYSTYTVLLTDTAPPTFIQKPKRKDHFTDKEVRLDHSRLFDTDLEDRTGPARL